MILAEGDGMLCDFSIQGAGTAVLASGGGHLVVKNMWFMGVETALDARDGAKITARDIVHRP